MTAWEAVILGVVEGVTEYLPVSSTGHLILTQKLLGLQGSVAIEAYTIVIQAGAILAVLGLYAGRVRQMILGIFGRDREGLHLAGNLLTALVPAVVIGLLLEKKIKEHLFGGERWGLWPTVLAWFVGGVAILAVGRWRRNRERASATGYELPALTWRMALVIGLLQCVAMWPGVSRSLMTIVAGILVGLSVPAAVEFSFLLGVVTLTGAAGKDGISHREQIVSELGVEAAILGILVAALSAAVAVKWMVAYLNRHGLQIFGWYRVVLAIAVAALLLGGIVEGPRLLGD